MEKTSSEQSPKKIRSAISFAISAILFIVALVVFFLALQAKKENRPITVFGRFFSIVVTDSMEPEIKVGDLIVVKITDMNEVKVGDNAVFINLSDEKIKGERVVHEVIEIGTDEKGLYFITKGINNLIEDKDRVYADNFVGIEVGHSTFWGKFFGFFTRIENLILLVVLLFAIPFAVKQIKKIIVYSKEAAVETAAEKKAEPSGESIPADNDRNDENE